MRTSKGRLILINRDVIIQLSQTIYLFTADTATVKEVVFVGGIGFIFAVFLLILFEIYGYDGDPNLFSLVCDELYQLIIRPIPQQYRLINKSIFRDVIYKDGLNLILDGEGDYFGTQNVIVISHHILLIVSLLVHTTHSSLSAVSGLRSCLHHL